MTFAEQVKPLWDKTELTLQQLAERCNISESSASRYINGKTIPPADVAEKMLQILGGGPIVARGESENMNIAIQQIREIYEKEIETLRTVHDSQLASLYRDKVWMFRAIVVLFCFIVYLFIDGMHGNWGFFQYPVV